MSESVRFSPDLVGIETVPLELNELRPEGFDAGELRQIHNENIALRRQELVDTQEAIVEHRKGKPLAGERLKDICIIGSTPPEPKVIEAIALLEIGEPIKIKGGSTSPYSERIEQWAATGNSQHIQFVQTLPEELEKIQNLQERAYAEHPLGVLLSYTIGRQRAKWQASDLEQSEGTEHIRSIAPRVPRVSCHEIIRNGQMARFFLTQQVLDRVENDYILATARKEADLLEGRLPPEETKILSEYVERQYMDYQLRQEGYKPFTIKELIDLQTGVYEKVKQELYGPDDYNHLSPADTSY